MSQTNSLKLMEPLPSWSISPISSWQKVVDCPFFLYYFHICVPWQSLKNTAGKSAPDKGIVDICHHRQIWQISPPYMRITALMDISQKVKQQLDLDEEKRTKQSQNEAKQTKQNPKRPKEKRTRKPAAPGLTGSTQRCASPCWERESPHSWRLGFYFYTKTTANI